MSTVLLFLFIILSGYFDAIGDSLKDIRTHMAAHPYKDFFHLAKYFERASMIILGINLSLSWASSRPATVIVAAAGMVIGRKVWDVAYRQPERWLALDERLKLSTGWKWLDKMLGFHW